MKRVFFLVLILLASTADTFAQSVSLTGTVTDTPDNQTWNSGTITFTFFGPQGAIYRWTGGVLNPNTPISAALSSGGTYSLSIPDNSQITPTDSSWNVKVCSGTLPQSCFIRSNVVVTSANSVLNLSPPSPRFPVPLAPQAIAPISAYNDTEIVGGWVGFSYYNVPNQGYRICNTVTVNQCTAWAASGSISAIVGPQSFSATAFGVKADGTYVFDATWTNAQNGVSCTNNDCNFAATDNGKVCWGIGTGGVANMPFGTLAVTGAQTANCATATGSQAGNGTFAWCTDDTNQWITLRNAYYASQRPAFIEGPGGLTCVTKAPLRDTRANTTNAAMWMPAFQSPSGMTIFVPTPTFDPTTCTSGAGQDSGCFWDTAPTGATNQNNLPQYSKVQNLGVNGLGFNNCGAGFSGASAAAFRRVEGSNIWLWNWCAGTAGFSCASVTAPNSFYNLNINSCGATGLGAVGGGNNSLVWLVTSYIGGTGMATLIKANSGANVVSKGSYYLTGCSTQCIVVNSGATMTMDGDQVNGASGNQFMDVAGNAFLINNVQFTATNNNGHAILTRATGKVYVKGSSISETGTSGIAFNVNLVPGGSIVNEGDNTIVGTDQTALTAAMVVLSAGWGTTATVTNPTGSPSSNPTRFSFQANSSGTGQAANPTMALTYPNTPTTPTLTCKQSGGTGVLTVISGESNATTTTMTLTFNGTPVAGSNYIITCTGGLQ